MRAVALHVGEAFADDGEVEAVLGLRPAAEAPPAEFVRVRAHPGGADVVSLRNVLWGCVEVIARRTVGRGVRQGLWRVIGGLMREQFDHAPRDVLVAVGWG